MATVTTTTASNPLLYPSQSKIERVRDGDLWVMVQSSTANTFELWRSTNGGSSWSLALSTVRANVQEIGSIQCLRAPYNQLIWIYRTYESGQDRVYLRTITDLGAGTLAWNTELLLAFATAGSAGAIYSGIDVANVVANGYHYVVGAVGSVLGASIGVTVFAATGLTLASLAVNNNIIVGNRWWVATGTGRVTPSIEIEHTGDGHSSNAPHVWVAWGRTNVYLAKLSWNGNGWASPTTPVQLNPVALTPAQDSIAARWDGNRFCVAVPDPASTSVVTVFERDRANSKTTIRQTPAHTTGVVRNCTLGYNSISGDLRVYAVGTSTAVLYYTDFIRATGTWSAWATVTATAILGVNNYSVRRATNGRYEVLTAHSGAPNTIVHTAQSLSYTPNNPTWDTASMGMQSGTAVDVSVPLTLDWNFSDPDPADTQSAYAVSRQIGAGALNYWRASDSTWQVAEVQNTSATTSLTLPASWGSASDAMTTFKVKTWDSAALASGYSDAFAVLPSAKVNPTITSPTPAAVLTADSVTLVWTSSDQSAYRVQLDPNPAHLNSNPFFETNASGWTVFGGTFVRSTAQFHQGAASGLLTPDGVSATAQVVTSPAIAVTPGTVYRGAAWVRCAVARQIRMAFDWDTVDNNLIFSVAANTWTLLEYALPAPVGSSTLQWWLAMDGTPPAGNLLYIDEAGVRPPAWYDSGWVTDSAARSLAVPYRLPDLSAWTLNLQTRNVEALASDTQQVSFTVDFVEPPAATLVATPTPADGVITVAITNPAAVGSQPAVADQDLYARPNTTGPNLLTNPGFEVNTTGWTGIGGTLARSTAQAHSGAASGLLTPDGATASPRVETTAAQVVVVAEGQTWTVDGWLRPTTANKPVILGIVWLDSGGAFVQASQLQVASLAGAWLYLSASFAVPVGVSVTKAGIRYGLVNTPAAGDTLYGDDLRLRLADDSTGSRVGTGLASGATFADWHAASGVDYEYRVLVRGVNGTSTYGPWTA